jgi:hypothetical protein
MTISGSTSLPVYDRSEPARLQENDWLLVRGGFQRIPREVLQRALFPCSTLQQHPMVMARQDDRELPHVAGHAFGTSAPLRTPCSRLGPVAPLVHHVGAVLRHRPCFKVPRVDAPGIAATWATMADDHAVRDRPDEQDVRDVMREAQTTLIREAPIQGVPRDGIAGPAPAPFGVSRLLDESPETLLGGPRNTWSRAVLPLVERDLGRTGAEGRFAAQAGTIGAHRQLLLAVSRPGGTSHAGALAWGLYHE